MLKWRVRSLINTTVMPTPPQKESKFYAIPAARHCIFLSGYRARIGGSSHDCIYNYTRVQQKQIVLLCTFLCSYTEFVSDLKPIWLGGIECTNRVEYEGRSSRRVVVEVG